MANDFPSRQDWWAPPATGTPAPSPSSPMAGALPLPSSPVGTPAGIVAGAPSGGAGGFDPKQLMQLLPLIFAKNNGARAAFLEGWERARQQDEQRKRWEEQQGIQQQAIDLRSEEQRQRVTEAERQDQTRADAQRQTAYERVREQWAKRLGTIRNKEEFDNALNQGERVLDSKFPGLHQPGDLAMMAGQFQPDTGLLDRFITSALTRKDDEAVLAMLQSNPEALARAQASGVVVGDQVVREPVKAPTPEAGFTLSEGQTRFGPDGKPIASVPKPRDEKPEENAMSAYSMERMQRTINSVDELLPQVNAWNTGFGSMLFSDLPATQAKYFKAQLDTLASNIAFGELTAMREASKTGGALGQVSDRESRLLSSALGAIADPQISASQMKAQLEKVKASIQRWYRAVNGEAGTALATRQVGDIVTVRGQKVRITKVNPDGTFEGTVVR